MENIEYFREGQEVWDKEQNKGVVRKIIKEWPLPVLVDFEDGCKSIFTLDGIKDVRTKEIYLFQKCPITIQIIPNIPLSEFEKQEAKRLTGKTLRPFEELITEIEHDGERFVPIVKIGELAFGFSEIDKRFSPKFWINDQEPNGTMEFYQSFGNKTYTLKVTIWEDGNVRISIGNNLHIPSNQVQIVKNLIKWRFVEP